MMKQRYYCPSCKQPMTPIRGNWHECLNEQCKIIELKIENGKVAIMRVEPKCNDSAFHRPEDRSTSDV
jgi:hypothetical protein